jgi:hypothetical protein
MAFRDLRRQVAEIDEQHRESMRTIDDDLGELHFGTDPAASASRRSFLTRAATGGAIAFGATAIPVAAMVPAALAQTSSTTAGSTPPTTKKRVEPTVTGGDLTVVQFAQTVELAAVAAYGAVINSGKLTNALAETARVFATHHQDHADALAKLAGSDAPNVANAKLVTELTPKIAAITTAKEAAQQLYNIEDGATATYAYALGVLQQWEAAGPVSTIMPIEGQHAIVWSQVIEPDPNTWATQIKTWIPNFQTSSAAFEPSKYAAS